MTNVPILFYIVTLKLDHGGAVEPTGIGAVLLLFRCINSKRARLGPPANFQQIQAKPAIILPENAVSAGW